MSELRNGAKDKVHTSAIDELLKRNPKFFARINRQLDDILAKMCVRAGDREDLIAEAWLRAVQARERFAGDEAEHYLLCWLRRVVHFVAVDQIRRSVRLARQALDGRLREPIDEAEAKRAEMAEWLEHVSTLLEKFSRAHEINVRLFHQHFFHGYSLRYLAQQYGMTRKGIDHRIRRVGKTLQKKSQTCGLCSC